jgi:hypothetical protein
MTLREARDAYGRAWRLLQLARPQERTFRAKALREARATLRKAQAMAALQAQEPSETERRVAELEKRCGKREAA